MPAWVYGVALVVVGAIGNNLGNNLVSLGHKRHQEKTDRLKVEKAKANKTGDLTTHTEISEPNSIRVEEDEGWFTWTNIGRTVFVLGNLLTWVAYAWGAQSLIAALESVQFVSNVFFVHYVHHEPVTNRMIIATLSIVVGNILVVLFSSKEAHVFTSNKLIHLYETNYAYHVYVFLALSLWAFTSWVFVKYNHSRMKKRILLWNHSFVEPFSFCVSASIIGTQAVLNSKSLALLLDATSRGEKNEFAFWFLYLVLGTWLLMVAYWLVRLDQSLALFPPMFIIPVIEVCFTFFAILCGGIYFQEFVNFTIPQYIGFAAGVGMILAGVYGLAPPDMKLYIPGDPDMPVEDEEDHHHCVAAAGIMHCELDTMEAGALLDKVIDSTIHIKPQPNHTEEVNLYSSSIVPEDHSKDEEILQFQASTATGTGDATRPNTTQSTTASKKNRRIVKRPQGADGTTTAATITLPPVQVHGGNGNGRGQLELQQQQELMQLQHPATTTITTTNNNCNTTTNIANNNNEIDSPATVAELEMQTIPKSDNNTQSLNQTAE